MNYGLEIWFWTDKQQLEHTGEGDGPLVLKIVSYKDV
jgi:hypothetical protein